MGLTATPERSDQADILGLCDSNLIYERNLVFGINHRLLTPFHYYGIDDPFVNYEEIPWRNGRFATEELSSALASRMRAKHVLTHWESHKQHRTLAFCISKRHADFMAKVFQDAGYRAAAVYSGSTVPRNEALDQLEQGVLDIIFSVDLFNEGTDLPAIDTVLMLRPTESKIIFLQQLGRGLRLHESKEHLVVIDFIGNHKSFLLKPMTLHSAETTRQAVHTIQHRLTSLPDGCFANYTPEAIELLERMVRNQKASIVDEYQSLKSLLGYRPTATEFYLHITKAGLNFNQVRKDHVSWFELVKSQGDLSEQESATVAIHRDFLLSAVESGTMIKSFKMILLEAFLELDGFSTPPTEQALAEHSWHILHRRPDLVTRDLSEKNQTLTADSKAWLKYWQGNPIKAFTSGSSPWFLTKDGVFQANVPSHNTIGLADLIHELICLRLEQYQKR